MTAVLAALAAGCGAWLLAVPAPERRRGAPRERLGERARRWFAHAGIEDARGRDVAAAIGSTALAGAVLGMVVFGAPIPALAVAAAVAALPLGVFRQRRRRARFAAVEAWPAMIDEIRVLTGSAGRSIPRALLEVGRRAPEGMRSAFRDAEREWSVTTDFTRTVDVLEAELDSATADIVCETLLVANQLGGVDLDRRLAELAEDRRADLMARKDALAQQAGVRFARRFVILVPAGMALAGLSLGDGRSAYQEPVGQALVLVGVALIALCWMWSGRMMRIPDEQRVFR